VWCGGAPALTGHLDSVSSVVFSPDGHRIASGSSDSTVQVWDAASGEPVGPPLFAQIWVGSVAFSPDGNRIVSGGGADRLGTVAVRAWPADAETDVLCAKLTANMSRQQWREWVSPDIDYTEVCPGLPIPADG
jgi:WD40 repeat protein